MDSNKMQNNFWRLLSKTCTRQIQSHILLLTGLESRIVTVWLVLTWNLYVWIQILVCKPKMVLHKLIGQTTGEAGKNQNEDWKPLCEYELGLSYETKKWGKNRKTGATSYAHALQIKRKQCHKDLAFLALIYTVFLPCGNLFLGAEP